MCYLRFLIKLNNLLVYPVIIKYSVVMNRHLSFCTQKKNAPLHSKTWSTWRSLLALTPTPSRSHFYYFCPLSTWHFCDSLLPLHHWGVSASDVAPRRLRPPRSLAWSTRRRSTLWIRRQVSGRIPFPWAPAPSRKPSFWSFHRERLPTAGWLLRNGRPSSCSQERRWRHIR